MPTQGLMALVAALALGYLIGSIPFAKLVAEQWKNVDLRRLGSGNIGAANAFVVAGKAPAIAGLLGDGLKGVAAMALARVLVHGWEPAIAAAAVGAVVGHDWSAYLHLRGGKGTATTIGVILALDWRILVLGAAAYLIFFTLTHLTVISSLIAVAAMPVTMVVAPWVDGSFGTEPLPYVYATAVIAAIGYLRHWDHVERFLQGREPKAVDMFREMKRAGQAAEKNS